MFKSIFNLQNLFKVSTVILLLFITIIFFYSSKATFLKISTENANSSSKVRFIIQDELSKYVYGLQGAKGVLVVNDFKGDPEKFRAYAESRDNFKNFEGILGYGFIRYFKNKDLSAYKKSHKNRFTIHPAVEADDHMVIELIEPLNINKKALGFDIGSEKKRREAAMQAAQTGLPVLTKKINLVQRSISKEGLLFLLPIYDTAKTPSTVSSRLSHLVGWSYSPIVLDSLMASLAIKLPSEMNIIIQIEDKDSQFNLGDKSSRNLFLTEPHQFLVNVGGTTWQVTTISNLKKYEYELIFIFISYIILISLIGFVSVYIYKTIVKKENQIIEQAMWMDGIIESAGHAIIATDPTGMILTFNSAAEKMLGYSAEEMILKNNPGIFHDPNEVVERAHVLSNELGRQIEPGFEVFVAKTSLNFSDINEWTYVKKNGEKIRVRLCVTAIYNAKNSIIGYLGIAEDLSKEIEMEKIIDVQRVQMIERSKMSLLGEMAGGIAHEINTPLAIIVTLANQLSREHESHNFHGKLLKIKETSERINKIVKGLRLYSRNAENDEMELINLSYLVNMTLDLCRQKILNSQIIVKAEIDQEHSIVGRPTEVSQVLLNLISNSIDSVEELPEKWINIDVTTDEKTIKIMVTDSGNGIEESIVEKMMNPFFTTKEVGKGTGLGLSISKGIIEMHKGRFYYDDSSANTRFIIELPLKKAA